MIKCVQSLTIWQGKSLPQVHFSNQNMQGKLTVIKKEITFQPFMVPRCGGPICYTAIFISFFLKAHICQIHWHPLKLENEFPCAASSSRVNWVKGGLIIVHLCFFKKKKKIRGDIFICITSWKWLGEILFKSLHSQAYNYQVLQQIYT